MNKKQILASLAAIANSLDAQGEHNSASALTDVMRRVSQSTPWWQNDAGEPLYSPEAIRTEERASDDYRYEPDDYDRTDEDDFDDGTGEMLADRFNDIYNNWASHQEDLPAVEQKMYEDAWNAHLQQSAPHIEKMQSKYKGDPDLFDADRYLVNTWHGHPEFKDVAELIFSPKSVHRGTRFEDPDTLHNILDAAKAAVINGTDVLAAINSVPAEGQHGRQYEGPEDFGWDGGRED